MYIYIYFLKNIISITISLYNLVESLTLLMVIPGSLCLNLEN